MKKQKQLLAVVFITSYMLLIVATIFTLFPERTAAEELNFGNSHITPYQNKDANGNVEGPPTVRYAIGFMSIDIWRRQDGSWSPVAPGQSFPDTLLEWEYNFLFTDRIVRNVEVFYFDSHNPEHREFFENSRAGASFNDYSPYMSPVSNIRRTPTPLNGVSGTNIASFKVNVAGTIPLTGRYYQIPCESCNAPIEGRRYYFPIGFKFELDGQKRVRYFDHTTGTRIAYQGHNQDVISNMEKGKTMTTDVPQIPGYRYVGYKKKTYMTYWPGGNYGEPDGPLNPGPPPSFTYDGSFDTYIVHLYYEPDTTPDKPDLVAVDITANGPIEIGKSASFTAKWRVDHKPTDKSYNVKIMVDGRELTIESQPASEPGNYSMDFTYTFTSTAQKTFLLVVDSANAIAESDESNNQVSRSFTPGSGSSQPEPEEPPLVCTAPPVARITAPSEKMAGDLVEISGAESQATAPATIAAYQWQLEGTGSTLSGPGGVAIYPTPGSFTIALRVTDSNGCTGEATHRITITVPTPTAFPDYAGAPKENRKVTLDGTKSFSPPGYPITRYEWTIEPVSGGSASAIKYDGTLTGSRKDLLIKQAGTYVVTLTVTNSYGISATASRQIVIAPDEPPVASFTVVKEVLRDPARGMMAPLKARDASYSPDGDMIAQRIWSYRYDSDNDGDFDEETPVIIDTGNKTEIEHLVPDVGRYQIYLEVVESFGQPTIQQFVTDEDYRRGKSWEP